MTITIVGTGNMGSGLAGRFCAAGLDVTVTGREADKAKAVAETAGAAAGPLSSAARGEVIFLATPYGGLDSVLGEIGNIDGKVVVDISNPVTPDFMGLTIGHSTSAAEELARKAPGARVVKAFNTVFAQLLAAGPKLPGGETVPVFVASDDADAKTTVAGIARQAGFGVIDAGGLQNARYLEPLGGLNIYLGYGAGYGTAIAPTWLGLPG